jgi:hypothetical protein
LPRLVSVPGAAATSAAKAKTKRKVGVKNCMTIGLKKRGGEVDETGGNLS